jgi:hypothetical protein
MITRNTSTRFDHTFSIHGMESTLTTEGFEITQDIDQFLKQFSFSATSCSAGLRISLQALSRLEEMPEWVLAAKRHPVSRQAKKMGVVERFQLNMSLFQDQDRLIVDLYEHGVLVVDGLAGTAQGFLVRPESMDTRLRAAFFHMSHSELLRWKGLFVIHGVALERNGKGLLITGRPNQGKTTAGLSLLRAGYGFISDDFPFLHDNGIQVEMLAFQDWVDVREKSVGFFPELQTIDLIPRIEGASKDSFSVQDLYPSSQVESCGVNLILFPQVVDGQDSYVEPMSKHQVLKELLPQGLQVHNKELAKQEFQLYNRLVEQTPCYRLYFGQNQSDLATLLDPLLEP